MPNTYSIDSKPKQFEFDNKWIEIVNKSLDSYHETLNVLKNVCSNPSEYIKESYGVCNNTYTLRYIRPHDVSTYVSYVIKAVVSRTISNNVGDLELLSTALVRQFVTDNGCKPFENGVIYSKGVYLDDRNQSMEDLVLMCQNAWFDNSVLSKSDMLKRAETIRGHLTIMEKLNFVVNMRKLIASIPTIINDNKDYYCDPNILNVLEAFIQRFIIAACAINLCSLKQIMGYCVPEARYVVKNVNEILNDPNKRTDYDYYGDKKTLNDGVCVESIDETRYSPVFVVLSKGTTPIVSPGIRLFSGGDYSHASISFDKDLHTMYTFNGGVGIDDIYPEKDPGMQKESLQGTKFKDNEVVIYAIFIKNDVVAEMINTCEKMYEAKDAKYSYGMIVKKLFHSDKASKGDRFICSSFVNEIIAMSGKKLVDKNIPSPHEMSEEAKVNPDRCLKLYTGKGGDFDYESAISEIEQFVKEDDSKPFAECVTECTQLHTTGITIRSRMPFNCNMRDMVLQDMHPEFKDTESAIKFMMNDTRSPIAILVKKFAKTPFREDFYGMRILHMFMHYKGAPIFKPNETLDDKRNALGMHTDVNWLDKITYGNEFLDGNYRADALGNNKFTPFETTLDTLYKMYCPCARKTNEDLANNAVEIACVMLDVIHSYVADRPDNWDMVRDILAVLGELFTRTALKLYHNNTMVAMVTDDMPDAGTPAYLYSESVIFTEADDKEAKVEVNVKNASGNMDKAKLNLKTMINKLIDWCKRVLGNAATAFKKNYAAQIKWIENNKQLNDEIKGALGNTQQFNITLTNAPQYNVKGEYLTGLKLKDAVDFYLTGEGAQEEAPKLKAFIEKAAGNSSIKGMLSSLPDDADLKAVSERIQNIILYGSENAAPLLNESCTPAYFESLLSNLTDALPALEKFAKDSDADITTACNELKKYSGQDMRSSTSNAKTDSMIIKLDGQPFMEMNGEQGETSETSDTNKQSEEDAKAAKMQERAKAIQGNITNFVNGYTSAIANVIPKKLFGESYKLYQQIVTGYKQVQGQLQTPAQNQTKTQEQLVKDANDKANAAKMAGTDASNALNKAVPETPEEA
jgi:hypothetical protein